MSRREKDFLMARSQPVICARASRKRLNCAGSDSAAEGGAFLGSASVCDTCFSRCASENAGWLNKNGGPSFNVVVSVVVCVVVSVNDCSFSDNGMFEIGISIV